MGTHSANAQWTGTLKAGNGTMKPQHATEIPFTFSSRFETQPSSNPEELIGAALAGCFAMALSLSLEQAGVKPQTIRSNANVHLEKVSDGFGITKIDLTTEANVCREISTNCRSDEKSVPNW